MLGIEIVEPGVDGLLFELSFDLSAPCRHAARGAIIVYGGHPNRCDRIIGSEIDDYMIRQSIRGNVADGLKSHPQHRAAGIGEDTGGRESAAKIQKSDVGLGRAGGNMKTAIDPPVPPRNENMHKQKSADTVDVDLEARRIEVGEELSRGEYRYVEDFLFHLVKTPAGGGERNRGFDRYCDFLGA